jgi:hypothetical protein
VLAGTSARGVCPRCLAPWRRVLEREARVNPAKHGGRLVRERDVGGRTDGFTRLPTNVAPPDVATLGWAPGCRCDAGEPIPATVLDPFLGSGTTALVADRLGRDAIGIELNPAYAEMARKRIDSDAAFPGMAEVAVQGAEPLTLWGEAI